MVKEVCCIICPKGCVIKVTGECGIIDSIEGFSCPRGETYARDEFIAPKRTITSTVKAEGYVSPVISVRSDGGIPKEKLMECMDIIRQTTVCAPFEIGRIVIPDILNTGVNIVLTNC